VHQLPSDRSDGYRGVVDAERCPLRLQPRVLPVLRVRQFPAIPVLCLVPTSAPGRSATPAARRRTSDASPSSAFGRAGIEVPFNGGRNDALHARGTCRSKRRPLGSPSDRDRGGGRDRLGRVEPVAALPFGTPLCNSAGVDPRSARGPVHRQQRLELSGQRILAPDHV
jgi:hypothetical protein